MAEKLGIPQITYLEEVVDVSGDTVRIRRNVGNGWEIVEAKLPVLVTVLDTANVPRPAAVKRIMKYKRFRTPVELGGEVGKEMSDASKEEQQAEANKKLCDHVWGRRKKRLRLF